MTKPQPQVGDPVFFEGLTYKIQQLDAEHNKVLFGSDIGSTVPQPRRDGSTALVHRSRFEVVGNLNDLQWSSRYSHWYLWGRLLGKARAGVGDEQRAIVRELRDRGLLPARKTRERGAAPAGGEHLGLYYCLFAKSNINWRQELANVRRGDGLSAAAQAACAEFDPTMPCKFGYAHPEDGDPAATAPTTGGR